jgi:2-oxoglutarate ferredoxin oxidoreductase subunit delta
MPKGFVCILVDRCKGCGFCVEFCPTQVLALSSALNAKGYHPPQLVNPDKCSGCDLCGMYCPDFAIVGGKMEAAKGQPPAADSQFRHEPAQSALEADSRASRPAA